MKLGGLRIIALSPPRAMAVPQPWAWEAPFMPHKAARRGKRLRPETGGNAIFRSSGDTVATADRVHGSFNRRSSSGAAHGNGSILIMDASSTRGPSPLGQK